MSLKRTLLSTTAVVGLIISGSAHAALIDINGSQGGTTSGPVTLDIANAATAENTGAFSPANDTAAGSSGGKETTFGAGQISQIVNGTTGGGATVWQHANSSFGNQNLAFFLYGIADVSSTTTATGVQLNNGPASTFPVAGNQAGVPAPTLPGTFIDVYEGSSALGAGNYNPLVGSTGSNTNVSQKVTTAGRTGIDALNNVTNNANGHFLMRLELVPGITAGTKTTLQQNVSATTDPATGSGSGWANCVSGSGCSQFQKTNPTDPGEFFIQFTIAPEIAGSTAANNGWQEALKTGSASTSLAVPEPGAIALFGVGLLGLGVVSRRRRVK